MTTDRLLEVEYRRGEEVVVRFRPNVLKGVPRSGTRSCRNATRELLLAFRSVLDGAIDKLTSPEAEGQGERGSRRRVEVTEEEGT